MNSSFDDAKSPFRSATKLTSAVTSSLDAAAPPRVVQKQVIHLRAGSKGCNAVLYLRLALPSSTKTCSYPLFPDEGVKLKSSVVYAVELTKGNRTVIPPDASQGLKRASRILALEDLAKAANGEAQSVVETASSSKVAKPRITSSQFHITVVCPPLQLDLAQDTQRRYNFVAVVQYEVSLALSPPLWPFVASVPIPRCLNNKLQFVTEEDEQTGPNDNLTVEFEPPLVHRPQPRARKSDESVLVAMTNGDETRDIDDVDDQDVAISGAFASSESLTIRWANAEAGKSENGLVILPGGRHPLRAEAVKSSMVVEDVMLADDNEEAQLSIRVELTIRSASYPALDKTAALPLAILSQSNTRWVKDTLNITCSRNRTLQSWSTREGETSILSRSSSLNNVAPSTSFTGLDASYMVGSSNGAEATADEDDNLANVQPPRGVADASVSFDNSVDSVATGEAPAPSAAESKERTRKVSTASSKSVASLYSQQSLHDPGDILQLVLRTASIREAHLEGLADIVVSLSGIIAVALSKRSGEEEKRVLLPTIVAQHIKTNSTVSVENAHVQLLHPDGTEHNASNQIPFEAGMSLTIKEDAIIAIEEGDLSGDTSAATALPSRRSLIRDKATSPLRLRSDESMEVLTIPGASSPLNSDEGVRHVDGWSGVVERAEMTVWVSNVETYTNASRKAVQKLQMSWPRTLAQSERAGSLLSSTVFAIPFPGSHNPETVHVLHAGIDGIPTDVNVRADDDVDSTSSSMIVEIPFPNRVQQIDEQPCTLCLVYSVDLPKQGPFCLFSPTGSTVIHLSVEVIDESVQDSVAIITYTQEPVSSHLQHDRDKNVVRLDTCILPSMSSILLDYAPRTKPLVTLLASPGAPLTRRITGSNTPLRNDVPLPPVRDTSFPASPNVQGFAFTAPPMSPLLNVPAIQSKSQARNESKVVAQQDPTRFPFYLSIAGLLLVMLFAVVLSDVYGTLRSIARAMDVEMSHERWMQQTKELMVRQDTSLSTIASQPANFLMWLSASLYDLIALPLRLLMGRT